MTIVTMIVIVIVMMWKKWKKKKKTCINYNKSDNNDNGSVDYDTLDDNDRANDDNEAWYNKAAVLMLNWTNKFPRTYCVHSGFAISTNEMMNNLFIKS